MPVYDSLFGTLSTHPNYVMAGQGSGEATAVGRGETYTYCTMNKILKYVGPVINGTVSDDVLKIPSGDNKH